VESALFQNPSLSVGDVGSKAHHLHRLTEEGFRVPPFIAISKHDISLLFGDAIAHIESLFVPFSQAQPSPDTMSELMEVCAQAEQCLMQFQPRLELQEALMQRALEDFGNDFCISVRSSAISEDASDASFAGQHKTYLYTRPHELIHNIKRSLASAWSFGALSYRLKMGVSIRNIEYAMVLQKMVFATRSGIAFSMNSNGNMADAVINCGYGMGEGIVMDQVAADCYHVYRALRSITRSVVTKVQSMEYSTELGIHLADVPADKQSVSALSEAEIFAVYDQVMLAEKVLGKPADIEFVWGEDGLLYLLQMRPITTIHREDLVVLDNTNIVESYPNITLPLSYSFASMAYTNLFRRSAKAFWISSERFDANAEVFDHLIEHFYGRVYYRLDNWYRMMALVYNSKRSMQAWETAVGLPDSASDAYHFPLMGKIKTALSVSWLVINYKRGNKRFFKDFGQAYQQFQAFDQHRGNVAALWQHLESSIARTFEQYHLTIVNDYLAFKAFGWLQDAIQKFGISENPELANELVVGQGGVESELAVMSFLTLKARVLSTPGLLKVFALEDFAALEALKAPEFADFYRDWQSHLQRFGDRTLAELKLEVKSPRQFPEMLVQLMKSQLDSAITVENFKERQAQIHANAVKLVEGKLRGWQPKSWWFRWVLGMSRYGLANRENMRFCRTRVYSVSKDIFRAIAECMVTAGHLEDGEDVFYLTMDEIKRYALVEPTDMKGLVEARKAEYANYKDLILPDRIIYSKKAKPDFTHYLNVLTQEGLDRSQVLNGVAVSKGVAEGEALVITEPVLNADVKGKILVSKMTDPGWVFLMSQAIALVTEKGSLLSHTAIVGRELGIPVVVAVQDATQRIKTGEWIRVNGSTGTIERIETPKK
jgi:phosphohistidine swiveling domain-containing protein